MSRIAVQDDAGHGQAMLIDDCFPPGHNLTTCCYSDRAEDALFIT